jgi:hypothetical protein
LAYSTSPTQRIPDFLVASTNKTRMRKILFKYSITTVLPSTALVPTSMITAPGLIQSPLISSVLPAAATMISACLTFIKRDA